MSGEVTTAAKGMFRVQDVSLKNPRRQSEVAKEIARERGVTETEVPQAPVSLTPESVKSYYTKMMGLALNDTERKTYEVTIKWIDELFSLRKEVVALRAKLPKEVEGRDDGSDIEE